MAEGLDAEVGQREDQDLLETTQVRVGVLLVVGEPHVLVVRVAAQGVHLGMLEQDEGVDALVPLPQRDELVLPRLHHPEGPAPALRARASSVVDPHPVGPPLRPGDPAP